MWMWVWHVLVFKIPFYIHISHTYGVHTLEEKRKGVVYVSLCDGIVMEL
jgi:hypothetical protein